MTPARFEGGSGLRPVTDGGTEAPAGRNVRGRGAGGPGKVVALMAAPFRDAIMDRRVAFASPVVAAVGALALFYGAGFAIYGNPGPAHGAEIAFGWALAILGMVVGIVIGWHALAPKTDAPLPRPSRKSLERLATLGLVLIGTGLVAIILYLVRIGELPILMTSVEQGRVDVAAQGGSPLRVVSLVALPGTWIVLAVSVHGRWWRLLVIAIISAVVIAALQLATANRANAFLLLEVGLVVGLLSAGLRRLTLRAVGAVAGVAISFVLAAGSIGAYRLYHSPETWVDPSIRRAAQANDYVRLLGMALRLYLIVPIRNTESTMDAVPNRLSWRLGYTYVQPLLTALPGRQTTFDQDLKDALHQEFAGGGTVPSFLGESYANFGPVGWLLVPLVLGFSLVGLYRHASARDHPAWWALYGYLIVAVCNSNLSGLSVASIFPLLGTVILLAAVAGPSLGRAVTRLR